MTRSIFNTLHPSRNNNQRFLLFVCNNLTFFGVTFLNEAVLTYWIQINRQKRQIYISLKHRHPTTRHRNSRSSL